MTPEAIIFDLDGTLIDSADDILLALERALALAKVSTPPTLNRSLIGPPISEILERCGLPLHEDTKRQIIQTFRTLYDNGEMSQTVPFPKADAVLNRLRDQGILLFVATNKPAAPTDRLLRRWFSGFFAAVFCVDSEPGIRLSKAQMVERILVEQSLDASRVWVVGDSVSDMEAAVHCGCLPIGVSYGYESSEQLVSAGARRMIATLSDL